MSHHEGAHVTSAKPFPGKTDFLDWRCRSPGLSPLEFFFWGHLKERVYRYIRQALTKLKEAIGNEIRFISSEVTNAVFNSMKKRAQDCSQSGGH